MDILDKYLNKVTCSDCLPVMKSLPDGCIDLILTDPPYGIGADQSAHRAGGKHGWKDYGDTNWDNNIPSEEYFWEMLRISKNQIIWGGNYFTEYLYPSMGWLVWDKGQREFSLADGELAWTSFNKALRIFTYSRSKALRDGKEHPTQKALQLIQWCLLNSSNEGDIIFDGFLGTGTTALACENLKRRWIGVEINPKYCEIAEKRIKAERSQGKLF